MAPKAMSIGPKRLCGRRRHQYKPATTGPRMKSAFCTASQPGYDRNSADRVTHTAAAEAAEVEPGRRGLGRDGVQLPSILLDLACGLSPVLDRRGGAHDPGELPADR